MLNQSTAPPQRTPPALDLVFQALADPTRRLLVERLCRGPASVTELAQPLNMSLPAVMQHLQVLEASALVRSEKVGRVRTCRVETGALRSAEQWIAQRRASWERSLDRLGAYLAETAETAEPAAAPQPAAAAAPSFAKPLPRATKKVASMKPTKRVRRKS